ERLVGDVVARVPSPEDAMHANCFLERRSWLYRLLGCGLLAATLSVLARADPALPAPVAGAIDFTRDVAPLLQAHCLTCHGPDRARGGLRLDNADAVSKGGKSGAVIRPGRSGDSRLILV